MKKRTISNLLQLDEIELKIALSAGNSVKQLHTLIEKFDPIDLLSALKFEPAGFDPLDPQRSLNLVEQLNQTFTYLASVRAVRELWNIHPSATYFDLNLGTQSGTDVYSDCCCGIAAEVFSAVTPRNNDKLRKDVKKVARVEAHYRYVFFMCPNVSVGLQESLPEYPEVNVWSLPHGRYTADAK